MDFSGNEFTFPQLFGLAGVGNKKQLIDSMVQFTHFSIIEQARLAYCGEEVDDGTGTLVNTVTQECADSLFPWDTTESPQVIADILALMGM